MATTYAVDFAVANELSEFTVPMKKYLEDKPEYHLLAVGAQVYWNGRVLLVQRSASDSIPLKWETPGGACDEEDATVLHAASRELFEESGLYATRIARLVSHWSWHHRRLNSTIVKYNFVVEVKCLDNEAPKVKLDPKEHEQFVWATKVEVEADRTKQGNIALNFTSTDQKQSILDGFP